MSNHAHSAPGTEEEHEFDVALPGEETVLPGQPASARARPIPRISIQAFCENGAMAEILQITAEDRRLAKAHVNVHMGGIEAAVTHYQENPTPNLIIVESSLPREQIVAELDRLAESCDPGTKVIVIGHTNDIVLYRDLLKRGVSEYLVEPIAPLQLMEAISNLYNNPETEPVGHVYAFIGAKGGVGSSTICHNTAWALSEVLKANVVIADLDLAFGTTGLDFNQDPVQGIADALSSPERLDEVLLDRLLTKCSEHLSIFAAPVVLDRDYDITVEGCDQVIDVVRQNVPYVVVDLPHTWTAWTKSILLQADEVMITAAPGPRQPAQRQEHRRSPAPVATQRQQAAARHEHGQHAQAPGDQREGVRERARPQGHMRHRFRHRDVRSGCQQRADDRGAQWQGQVGRGVPRHSAGDDSPPRHPGGQKDLRPVPALRNVKT